MALFIALIVVASVTAMGLAVSLARLDETTQQSGPEETVKNLPVNIQLAAALSGAINAGDVDEVVELFTEEDAGPTVVADRFAWEKFEIRLWASDQAAKNMHMDTEGYQLTEHGATWDATAYRDDWSAVGVHGLSVTNSIWVQDGKIASFTSVPRSATDVQQLGKLWRTGATPEH